MGFLSFNTMASNSNWKRTRKFLNDIHLWLGLASGLILFVVCLTGTVYTFHSEIDEWLNSEKYRVEVPGVSPLSVEELAKAISQQVEGQIASVTIPSDAESSYQFSVRKEGERRGTTYLVNPYTAEVLGNTKSGASEFFMIMFRLHRWLLLDTSIGRPIVGWSTVIFVFLILTGLIIWIPQKVKSWKQGLKIKWSANWKRINHDLHNALGLYTAIFLLVMALSGLQWSFDWYRTGLRSALGVEQPAGRGASGPNTSHQGVKPEEKDVNNSQQDESNTVSPLSIAQLLNIVDEELPYPGSYRIEIPDGKSNTVKIGKYHAGFFASPAADDVSIDVYSGEILSKQIFSEKPFNERVARSIKALHVGDVFGTFSKIIYFISCLIATILPVTGTLIWINKLKKKSKKKPYKPTKKEAANKKALTTA